MICAVHGYKTLCVVDPKTPQANLKLYKILGAEIEMVVEKDENGVTRKRALNARRKLPEPEKTASIWINMQIRQLEKYIIIQRDRKYSGNWKDGLMFWSLMQVRAAICAALRAILRNNGKTSLL